MVRRLGMRPRRPDAAWCSIAQLRATCVNARRSAAPHDAESPAKRRWVVLLSWPLLERGGTRSPESDGPRDGESTRSTPGNFAWSILPLRRPFARRLRRRVMPWKRIRSTVLWLGIIAVVVGTGGASAEHRPANQSTAAERARRWGLDTASARVPRRHAVTGRADSIAVGVTDGAVLAQALRRRRDAEARHWSAVIAAARAGARGREQGCVVAVQRALHRRTRGHVREQFGVVRSRPSVGSELRRAGLGFDAVRHR